MSEHPGRIRFRDRAEYYRQRSKEAHTQEVREAYAQLAEEYDKMAEEADEPR